MKTKFRRGRHRSTEAIIEPQPIIRSSLDRFVYATDRSDQGVTGLAGMPLAIEAFHALGLDEVCARELRLEQRRRGPTEAEWVEVLTMLHLAGGTSLEDLRVFKLYAYEHGRAYQPTIVLWSEQDLILHDQFRDGNVPAAMGNVEVLRQAIGSRRLGSDS